jgi:aminopeptidase N
MRRVVAAVLLVAALPACEAGVRRAGPTPTPSPAVSTTSSPAPTAAACPASYAAPRVDRPDVTLTFALDDAHAVVTGHEHVRFTPDRTVTDWVFRLWANAPSARASGGRMEITHASLPVTMEAAGGVGPGTLARLRLPIASTAGVPIEVDLDFRFALPRSDFDRWGHTGGLAWWATGHPLLAWVYGRGWVTEPASAVLGETAVSEAARYDVTVTAPGTDTVVGNGVVDPPVTVGSRKRWHWTNDRARDAAVAVGRFATRRETVQGTPVLIAVEPGLDSRVTFGPVLANVRTALADLTKRYGPFPFPSLTVVALKAVAGGGIEYPGLIYVGSRRYDVVVPHEVAHEWFYGMVGDDQARDPWLDEAFATYSEALVNDTESNYLGALGATGAVGNPMSEWHDDKAYGTVVYGKGAAALLTARDDAGAAAFDAALRCYVRRNAFGVAGPEDLREALASLPKAIDDLVDAGAF